MLKKHNNNSSSRLPAFQRGLYDYSPFVGVLAAMAALTLNAGCGGGGSSSGPSVLGEIFVLDDDLASAKVTKIAVNSLGILSIKDTAPVGQEGTDMDYDSTNKILWVGSNRQVWRVPNVPGGAMGPPTMTNLNSNITSNVGARVTGVQSVGSRLVVTTMVPFGIASGHVFQLDLDASQQVQAITNLVTLFSNSSGWHSDMAVIGSTLFATDAMFGASRWDVSTVPNVTFTGPPFSSATPTRNGDIEEDGSYFYMAGDDSGKACLTSFAPNSTLKDKVTSPTVATAASGRAADFALGKGSVSGYGFLIGTGSNKVQVYKLSSGNFSDLGDVTLSTGPVTLDGVEVDPSGNFLLVTDKSLGKVYSYRIEQSGTNIGKPDGSAPVSSVTVPNARKLLVAQ
ncbi:MAG: hypothetical protein KF884_07060 [Fimbriimonadaceae bacterium]|nr:hypothetical protein [Fimbriimonadaceae bacterium]QYK57308.1 MAG: hypothetical protein KF884_07060 [Fimbriimonadaceae bacterium]